MLTNGNLEGFESEIMLSKEIRGIKAISLSLDCVHMVRWCKIGSEICKVQSSWFVRVFQPVFSTRSASFKRSILSL